MEGVVLPLLQPVAEDPDPDVRCRAVQLLTHLVTEASSTWAAQSLAIISSVSVCVCVHVSMHVVCVCVCVCDRHTLHYIHVSQVLQKGLEVATENRSNRVRNVCLSCRSLMQLLRPLVFHCSHSTILGGPKATRLQGSCLWTHTSIQGRPPPRVQFPLPPTHAHIYRHRYIILYSVGNAP